MCYLRAVGASPEPPPMDADDEQFGRPITDADEDNDGGMWLADDGDIGFFNALWISHFLFRVHVDALGCWFTHGFLHRRDCFNDLDVRSPDSLLRHGTFLHPEKILLNGSFCEEQR
ncbi:uncharacterized protein LOC120197789 [Hibiscus syriacus]|uniref:uncharacterized protein LOC120197789 n=1 Tax=Hibiscus syriacus TaxID=106335 RepID=UPI001923C165|nr:uncharacterized protein LOC120197789 [Hibiscus syriacus]